MEIDAKPFVNRGSPWVTFDRDPVQLQPVMTALLTVIGMR